jgi:hypothetical protein
MLQKPKSCLMATLSARTKEKETTNLTYKEMQNENENFSYGIGLFSEGITMNRERINNYLTLLDDFDKTEHSLNDKQRITKAFMNELFPNLPRENITWLAGYFMASHFKGD